MGIDIVNRAVFLDRDGVLLDHSGLVISGARAVLNRLKLEGFLLICVTNQPDVTAGLIPIEELNRVHVNLRKVLPLDDLLVCIHADSDKCECRNPKPGMLIQAAEKRGVDLPASYMVGDRWRDISAGRAAGCRTILIGTGFGEPFPDKPDYRAADLAHAAELILEIV